MTTAICELENRTVLDTGEVVYSYELLLEKALSGESISEHLSHSHFDVEMYNSHSSNKIPVWEDGGPDSIEGPPSDSYQWLIPKYYRELDINELTITRFEEMGISDEAYAERLAWELGKIEDSNMSQFIRCLVYITDTFKKNGVVWGVGRGSSCASLVLFVLGVNRIDPIQYDISPEEFFRDEQ